jgi:type III pantothenate kinase
MAAPQLLLIDVGNTRVKWATIDAAGTIRPRGAFAHRAAGIGGAKKLAREYPRHKAVLACVVPKRIVEFKRAFSGRLHVITAKSCAPDLSFDYPKPRELGADRLSVAVAAQADGKIPAIILGCGTALAFTVLDAKGRLCGGAIAPGLTTQLRALLGATAQLPVTTLRAPRKLPARSTQEAIRAGVILNFQGGAREIATRLCESLAGGASPRLLLTGGDADVLRGVFGPAAEVRPLLVFEGLRIIGMRHFGPLS